MRRGWLKSSTSVVRVRPGDTIVFHLVAGTTQAQREHMVGLAERIFPDNPIVLTMGVERVTIMEAA